MIDVEDQKQTVLELVCPLNQPSRLVLESLGRFLEALVFDLEDIPGTIDNQAEELLAAVKHQDGRGESPRFRSGIWKRVLRSMAVTICPRRLIKPRIAGFAVGTGVITQFRSTS